MEYQTVVVGGCGGAGAGGDGKDDRNKRLVPKAGGRLNHPPSILTCPRCHSTNTKFCYYNNYSLSQPRHYCKGCRRYWTQGGTLRNVPVGGKSRKGGKCTRMESQAVLAANHQQSAAAPRQPRTLPTQTVGVPQPPVVFFNNGNMRHFGHHQNVVVAPLSPLTQSAMPFNTMRNNDIMLRGLIATNSMSNTSNRVPEYFFPAATGIVVDDSLNVDGSVLPPLPPSPQSEMDNNNNNINNDTDVEDNNGEHNIF